jgi:hypothetical protein
VTRPETTASPRPGLASITTSFRAPVTGLAVNSTPAVSAAAMRWTTTASFTVAWSSPRCSRYAIARSVQSDAQQRRTASSSASDPTTLRNVSCWPANAASGRSSAVALERAATGPRPSRS